MTFTSLEFPLFFLMVLALCHWTRTISTRQWLLLLASYLFYLSSGVSGIIVLLFTSGVDFHVGRRLGATVDAVNRKRWLYVSLTCSLGLLAFFKYTNFFLDNVRSVLSVLGVYPSIPHYEIVLPIGISYFTFCGISYVLDVYYERLEASRSASEYLLYVAFFPKILAGPIARATELLPQFREWARASAADVEIGIAYFLLGAVKKLVIADQLAGHVSLIFAAPSQYDAMTLFQGLLGYTVQIYCDFSGYTDMAIGCARIMGIRLPENFLMPYSSVNITEFWRRWHVTLSNWFRDYVFLPLEFRNRGIRNAEVRVSMSLMLTMSLCGLWHGASWNFVFWGSLHGGALAMHRTWRAFRPISKINGDSLLSFLRSLSSRVLTLSVVMVGWIFFRAESWSLAVEYLRRLFTWRSDGITLGSAYILPLTAVVFVTHLIISKNRNVAAEISQYSVFVRVASYSTALLLLSSLVPADRVPFVYFQF